MTKKILIGVGAAAVVLVGGLALAGHLPLVTKRPKIETGSIDKQQKGPPPIAVTVARAKPAKFVETVLVTGSLVPREEILVGPEVEGLRIVEVLADEGDRVKKGQVLARLVGDTLEAQLAANTAAMARADASIAQARSNIVSAEAKLVEAKNAYDRGKPLKSSGYLSESVMDQRVAAQKTAEAALMVSKDGLKVAEADKAQTEAQRREIAWRRGRTEVVAPADGIISRRVVRIGGFAAGAADAMFRIIAKGEVELDAEITETRLMKVREGQHAEVSASGNPAVQGKVRLVSPEIDRATRLGRVRVSLGDNPAIRIGAFARGQIETGRSEGLAIPASAVLYGAEGPSVQVVANGAIKTRRIKLGLEQNGLIEVKDGLADGEQVVAKSGTFLRDGDAVRPVPLGEPPRTGDAG